MCICFLSNTLMNWYMCNSNSHFSSAIASAMLTAWLFCGISIECLQAPTENENICFLSCFFFFFLTVWWVTQLVKTAKRPSKLSFYLPLKWSELIGNLFFFFLSFFSSFAVVKVKSSCLHFLSEVCILESILNQISESGWKCRVKYQAT